MLATQNPMDLDYRALSNAGTWVLGRLSTDADRARVLEGLGASKRSELATVVKKLAPRWFVVREPGSTKPTLLYLRRTMSYLRGPMTPMEIRRAREGGGVVAGQGGADEASPSGTEASPELGARVSAA